MPVITMSSVFGLVLRAALVARKRGLPRALKRASQHARCEARDLQAGSRRAAHTLR
jgi:hypothetical protein